MRLMFLKDSHVKVYIILFSMILFSMLYMFLKDENFSGINIISETIRNELIKEKVIEDIEQNKDVELFSNIGSSYEKKDKIDKKVEDIEDDVKKEYTSKNIEKSFFQRFFDRLYFSIITGCLLGYGDIYPKSNISKFFVMIQSLLTIIIIVY